MSRVFYIISVIILFTCCKSSLETSTVSSVTDSLIVVERYPAESVRHTIKYFISGKEKIDFNFSSTAPVYKQNNFNALWNSDSLIFKGIELINNSKYHGLNPKHYNKDIVDSLNLFRVSSSGNKIETLALLDIVITDGVLQLCNDLAYGKLNPKNYHESWNYPTRQIASVDSVLLYLVNNAKAKEIESYFSPNSKEYSALQSEFRYFILLKSSGADFNPVKYPDLLVRKGDSNLYVFKLKQALLSRGYTFTDSLNMVFNSDLEKQVKAFQTKHGLTADGLPGRKTYDFLNWSIQKYINTLRVNMERMRWMQGSARNELFEINIPAYSLDLYSNNKLLFNTKVIVGKYKNQTPVLSSEIDYIVFNPCWTIPNSIASEKILPKLKRDSTYLDTRNMFVQKNGVTQDHSAIDFSKYNENNFPYKIFQRTGAGNALGKVKFMFKNSYSIYLHDTPSKALFARDHRAFSHGCVRVQKAVELSAFVLYNLDKNSTKLSYYFKKGYPEKVYLKKPIGLSIKYLTCNYNAEINRVQYFKDIYVLDYKVLSDLE